MALNKKRIGEISYLFLKEIMRKRGLNTLNPNELKREIGNEAKKMGIETEEALEFNELITRELVEEMFSGVKES